MEKKIFSLISNDTVNGHCVTILELGGAVAAWAGASLYVVRVVSDVEVVGLQSCGRCLVYYVQRPRDAAGVSISVCLSPRFFTNHATAAPNLRDSPSFFSEVCTATQLA